MDYDAQRMALAERLRQAQAMQQAQVPQGQMVGRIYVPPAATQYLSAGLRQFAGAREAQNVQNEQKALGEKQQTAIAEALRNFGQKAKGAPAQPTGQTFQAGANEMGDEAATVPQWAAAQKPDMMGAYQALLQAPDTQLRNAGMQGMLQMPQIEAQQAERQENRDFRRSEREALAAQRMQELQQNHQLRLQQMQEQNASRQQMAEEQRAHQRSMAQLAASLRAPAPTPQAQVIQTESGPMILQPGSNQAMPIVGPGGTAVKPAATASGATKPLTESQAKGALYLGQMRSATAELGTLPSASPVATAAAGNTYTNWATPANAQKVAQLQNQWAEAYLRAKTGAAATAGEVDLNRRTYFPVVGDSAAVIAQKKQMREQAERDMEPTAGPAAATAGGVDKPKVVDFGSLK